MNGTFSFVAHFVRELSRPRIFTLATDASTVQLSRK